MSDVKLLMKEIVKMVNFDHPNVMTLTGVILVEGGAPLLVMPYMIKGTLLAYVRDNKSQLFLENEENKEKVSTTSYSIYVQWNPSIRTPLRDTSIKRTFSSVPNATQSLS